MCENFYSRVPEREEIIPYSYQLEGWNMLQNCRNVIFDTGTGAGKTEAAFFPALSQGKQIILIYPDELLLEDQKNRLTQRFQPESLSYEYKDIEIAVDRGECGDRNFYRPDIILTSMKSFICRLLGFGSERWGCVYPWRLLVSENNILQDTILIFDEVWSCNINEFSYFIFLINRLTYENNVQTVILSATLPEKVQSYLLDRRKREFPRPEREFFVAVTEKPAEIERGRRKYIKNLAVENMIEEALSKYREGCKVVVFAEKIFDEKNISLRKIQEMLLEKAGEGIKENVVSYHRFLFPEQRKESIDCLQEKQDGYILITGKEAEVGTDFSADVLFTEYCSPESFIRRLGRCTRREGTGEIYTYGEDTVPGSSVLREFLTAREGEIIGEEEEERIKSLFMRDIKMVNIQEALPLFFTDRIYRYIYDFNSSLADSWQEGMVFSGNWLPDIYIQYGDDREERIRIPVKFTLQDEKLDNWWLEYVGENGKRMKVFAKYLEGLDEKNFSFDREKEMYIFDPHRVDLVLKFSGEEFGLSDFKIVQPDCRGRKEGYPLRKYIYEPVTGIGLCCWQLEGGDEHE
ncbi:MAG: DEAD/DEAH box helicase [Halanaerobiaceae bacterium]